MVGIANVIITVTTAAVPPFQVVSTLIIATITNSTVLLLQRGSCLLQPPLWPSLLLSLLLLLLICIVPRLLPMIQACTYAETEAQDPQWHANAVKAPTMTQTAQLPGQCMDAVPQHLWHVDSRQAQSV